MLKIKVAGVAATYCQLLSFWCHYRKVGISWGDYSSKFIDEFEHNIVCFFFHLKYQFLICISCMAISVYWAFYFGIRLSLFAFKFETLRDLVPLLQFKKREKHQWRSVIFSKVARFLNCRNGTESRKASHFVISRFLSVLAPFEPY